MGWGVGRQPGRRLLLGLAGIFAVSAVSAGLGTPAPTHVAAGGHGPDHWPPRPVAAAFEERWPPFDAVPGIPCYTSGPYLRVVYGYEAGRNNRIKQVDPLIREVVAYVDWLYNEAARASGGTRHIRWRMKDCRLEITTFAASAATLGDPTALNRALAQAGLLSGSEKALAFLDTAGWGCMGIAEMYPDDTPGQRNLNNTRSLVGLLFSECWTAPEARIMATEVAAHELSHTLGAVQDSAPHSTKFGHCWDGSDLMCYDDGWGPPKDVCALRSPERLDCNLDDYFSVKPKSDSYLARKWNVANSRWLAGTAPAKWERLPRARVAIDGPADKAVVAGRLRIGASSTAPAGYAIQRYVVVINGQRAGEIPADGSRPFRLDTFFDGDGSGYRNGEQLKVQVFAVDRHYRWSASAARRYTVSNPYIYLRRPTAYDSASGNLAWAVDATPGQGRTISKVELLVNGKVVAADTTKPYGGTWNAGSNPLSTVRIAARLTDDRGLARRTAERWLEPAAGGQVQLAWDGWGGRSVTDRALIVARVSSPEAVARVRFLLGSVEIGNDTSAPYALDWTPTAAGNVVARAELASGRVLVSEPMTVTLAAPAGNSLTVSASTAALPASGTVELQATPTPATGWSVSQVDFYLDGALQGTDFEAPWVHPLDTAYVANGDHLYTAVAQLSRSSDWQWAEAPAAGMLLSKAPPTLSLSQPTAGPVSGNVRLAANASRPFGGYGGGIDFYAGGKVVGSDWPTSETDTRFESAWDTRHGHDADLAVVALALDGSGARSSPVTLQVRNSFARLDARQVDATLKGTVNLRAAARCDSECQIEWVRFLVDGKLVGRAGAAPYSVAWDTRSVTNGKHSVRIVALSNDGRSFSSTHSVTVSN